MGAAAFQQLVVHVTRPLETMSGITTTAKSGQVTGSLQSRQDLSSSFSLLLLTFANFRLVKLVFGNNCSPNLSDLSASVLVSSGINIRYCAADGLVGYHPSAHLSADLGKAGSDLSQLVRALDHADRAQG